MPLSAQQTTTQIQHVPSSQATHDNSSDDIDKFAAARRAQQAKSQHRTAPIAVAACKDLEALGNVLDGDMENQKTSHRGELLHITAAINGVERYFVEPLAPDADATWDMLVDCANQTHSQSQRAEAFRVAAMWEGWRSDAFRKMYVNAQPVSGLDSEPIVIRYKLDPPTPEVVTPSKPAL